MPFQAADDSERRRELRVVQQQLSGQWRGALEGWQRAWRKRRDCSRISSQHSPPQCAASQVGPEPLGTSTFADDSVVCSGSREALQGKPGEEEEGLKGSCRKTVGPAGQLRGQGSTERAEPAEECEVKEWKRECNWHVVVSDWLQPSAVPRTSHQRRCLVTWLSQPSGLMLIGWEVCSSNMMV